MTHTGQRAAALQETQGGAGVVRIILAYAIFASLWIFFSDRVLYQLAEPEVVEQWSILKGLAFVLLTTALLYAMLKRDHQQMAAIHAVVRESETRLRLALSAASQGTYDLDLRTGDAVTSDEYARMLGHDPSGFRETSASWIARLHPDDREHTINARADYLAGRSNEYRVEFRQRTCDGDWKWILSLGSIVEHDEAGRPVRMLGTHTDITERKRAEAAVVHSQRQLRALLARLESLREEDRKRISREIHDELGQALTGVKMDLRWIERKLGEPLQQETLNRVLDRLLQASQLVDETSSTVQKIAAELRPGVLDNLGLEAALKLEGRRFEERSSIRCIVAVPESSVGAAPEVATALFRIFQESLTNVLRHAQASRVEVTLGNKDEQIELRIIDDGTGITEANLSSSESLGLLGMKERASQLGGTLTIQRATDRGTAVTVRMPRLTNHPSPPP